MDLISRQALRQAMYHEAFEVDSDMQKWDSGCWIRYKLFEKVIDNMPSASQITDGTLMLKYDEEVKRVIVTHGHWCTVFYSEEERTGEWIKDDYLDLPFVCSQCGFALENWAEGIFYNYCPHCGARMKGDDTQ